jgi:hypothetical protein
VSDCADFKENRLVSALVEDVANPPELLYAEGLIGQSNRRDYIRFYTTRTLEEYYDLPCPSVRHVVRLPRGERPFRADAIWVDPKRLGNSPAVYRLGDVQKPLDADGLAQTLGAARPPAEAASAPAEASQATSSAAVASKTTGFSSSRGGGDGKGGGGTGAGTGPKFTPP